MVRRNMYEKYLTEKNPVISVVVPVYNSENTLVRCIKSLQNQSFVNFEILLIDDGSTDSSSTSCDKFADQDKRIHVIHQNNSGVSVARNLGINLARGRYIVFVDSDDWVGPDYLCHLLNAVPDDNKQGLVMNGFLKYSSGHDDSVISKVVFENVDVTEFTQIGKALEEHKLAKYGFPFAKLYDKKLIDKWHLRFDERISFCEDLLFMYDYLLHAEFLVLTDSVDYAYMWGNPTSLSGRLLDFAMYYRCFIEYQRKMQTLLRRYNLSWDEVPFTIKAMMEDVFERALKTDFQHYNRTKVSKRQRRSHLRKLVENNYDMIRFHYHPVCKSDCLGKLLLLCHRYVLYDIYMCLLFRQRIITVFFGLR